MTSATSPLLPVPHLQQPALGECLPACTAMVLLYLGKRINYHQLVRLLQTRPGYGTPFSNVRMLANPTFPTAPIPVPHGDFDLAWLAHDEYYAVLDRRQ